MNTRALAGLPALLDRRAEELDSCRHYLDKYAVITDTGPVAATEPLRVIHRRVIADLGGVLAGCADALRDRADGVRAVVRGYEASDATSAALLDQALPQTAHHGRTAGPAVDPVGPEVFAAPWIAADQLRFPPDYRTEFPAAHDCDPIGLSRIESSLVDLLDSFGPVGSEVGGVVRRLTPDWTGALCGDWPGTYASADSYESMAAALAAIRATITSAVATLDGVWAGRAAALCATALSAVAGTVDRVAGTAAALAAQYRPAATAAREAAVAAESVRSALVDAMGPALGLGLSVVTVPLVLRAENEARQRLAKARSCAHHAATAARHLTDDLRAHH